MAGKSISEVLDTEKRRRGRPAKTVSNVPVNETATPEQQAGSGKSTKPRRDTFKVFSIRVSAEIEACIIKHGKETVQVLLNTNGAGWKSMDNPADIFYRMIERACRSKKGGARLMGLYYDANMALLPSQIPTMFVSTPAQRELAEIAKPNDQVVKF